MATKTLIPSTIYNAASSYLTITDQSNAYTDTSSNTYATIQNTNASTSNRYIYIRGFDFSQVPSTATVNSFTIKVKGYYTGGYSQSISVCNGTTTISGPTATSLTTSVQTRTFSNGSMTWATMKGYGSNFGIRINCRRNSRNTAATYYIYGAEIDVDYTEAAPVPVTGVSLDKATASIEVGETVTLTATVTPSNADDKSVSWSSSNTSVATVSGGVVTGVSQGTARITVTTTDGGFTAYCDVTVTPATLYEYVQTDTMTPGNTYLIANGNSGSVYLLTNESGGSRLLKGVTATVSNGRLSITGAVKAKAEFSYTLSDQSNPVTTCVMANGQYLYCDNASGLRMNTVANIDRFWHYNSTKFWQYKSTASDGYSDATSEYKYYLTVSNGNFTDSHVDTTSIEDSTLPAMYVFMPYVPSNDALYIKQNGSWVEATAVYKKVNGSWVEQNDLTQVFDPGTNYKVSN